ncbi:MAG: GNAT family N-acetyltransferase [Bryobacteraceae bacterium]
MISAARIVTPPLRFRIGEYAFWIWRPRLVAIDCSGQTSIDWQALSSQALEAGLDGYLCRNLTCEDTRAGVRRQGDWLVYVRGEEKSFHIEIRGTFEDYLSRFTAKKRRDLRRIIRRFQPSAEDSPLWIAKRPEEMEEFHRRAVEISLHTYQQKLFRAGIPADPDFVEKMKKLAAAGMARGYLLRLEGRPVAYGWCEGKGKQLDYVYTGYLPKYANLSPGTALLYLLLEDAFREKQFQVFSFGSGEIWYKQYFSTGYRAYVDAMVFRPAWRYRLLVRLHAALESGNDSAGKLLENWGVKRTVKKAMRWLAGVGAGQA